MREIGGYIELDSYCLPMMYEEGIKLNSGRNALAYIIKAKKIKKILMPFLMCDSCNAILERLGVNIRYYEVGIDFMPVDIERDEEEYLYIVNYYGQLSNNYLVSLGSKTIVDNVQAYFQSPVKGIDTIYTCRKFFGVADGAILFTDKILDEKLQTDESFERMHFLLGRYERSASEFYQEYVSNNKQFATAGIKKMSKLTLNLLHGIDYKSIKTIRTYNFTYLHERLKDRNILHLNMIEGAFMYPFFHEMGYEIREELQKKKIYTPILWPNVLNTCNKNSMAFNMAGNIVALPVDQRYGLDEMKYICDILDCIVEKKDENRV